MRIALVSDTYSPQVNGVTTILRRIVDALGHARHDVVVVAPAYPSQQRVTRADELRVPSMAFPPYPAIRLSLPAPHRVARFLNAFSPELVHVHTEGPLGMIGRRYALARGLPLVTSYHTHFPRYCREYGVPALERAVWHWVARFHRPAALVHTPGEVARAELVAHGIRQAVVWGQGVDSRRFHHSRRDDALRRRLGLARDQLMVLHVGRLAPEKNLDVLTSAFALAHEALGSRARFVIAGEGPGERKIAASLPWAVRLGFLPVDRLADLYASADLCVLPSHTETCGLVALEAMASGLPVIAADAGGFSESVVPGENGVLVSPGDAPAFASAICALAVDPARRGRLSAGARLSAVARDSEIENEELLEQYRRILGRGSERGEWRAAS